MKMLWLVIPVVFLVMWMMRRSSKQKARSSK
jgi:lipopolysaccharide biosynthesis regulator YciM